MKLSALFLIVACVALASAAHTGPNQKARKATHPSSKKAPESRAVTNYFDEETIKRTIENGADTLNKAITMITPLVRDSLSLGTDVVTRLVRGAPLQRSADNELLQRFDKIRSGALKAYDTLVSKWL